MCIRDRERRDNNTLVPNDLYVIEQIHIDNFVIWKNGTGEIYQSSVNSNIIKIVNSFIEFLDENNIV